MIDDEAGSTERVRRYRGHAGGDHSNCIYRNCEARREQEYQAEETLFTRAVFEELESTGVDPHDFWGTGQGGADSRRTTYDDARRIAEREIPAWLPQEIDAVTRLQARTAMSQTITEEMTRTYRIVAP